MLAADRDDAVEERRQRSGGGAARGGLGGEKEAERERWGSAAPAGGEEGTREVPGKDTAEVALWPARMSCGNVPRAMCCSQGPQIAPRKHSMAQSSKTAAKGSLGRYFWPKFSGKKVRQVTKIESRKIPPDNLRSRV